MKLLNNPLSFYYSRADYLEDIQELADNIRAVMNLTMNITGVYGVPQGGIIPAMDLARLLQLPLYNGETLVDNQRSSAILPKTVLVVDDIVDSGKTRRTYPDNKFACLHFKVVNCTGMDGAPDFYINNCENIFIQYWWEKSSQTTSPVYDNVVRILEFIGENPNREGLVDTPQRVTKAIRHLFSGYSIDPKDVITTFDSDGYDEMVLLKDIEFYSTCEHHMLPFFGKAHIAYIPDKKVIGISKLARLVEIFSRRLQIQERITEQITSTIMEVLQPKGAACVLEAQHLCMLSRGVEKQNSMMVTSSLKGIFLEKPAVREEFMRLIK